MNIGIELIENNIGVSLENTLLMLTVLGSIIIMAKDVKLGFVVLFMTSAVWMIICIWMEWEWFPSVVVCLCSFVLMTLLLYVIREKVTGVI